MEFRLKIFDADAHSAAIELMIPLMKAPLTVAAIVSMFITPVHAVPMLKRVAEVKGFSSPESIAWDGSHYYVSNVGKELKPMEKDGDGFISRMGPAGEDLKLDFITGLNAPKGMLVVGKTLYVCDVDVLLGFDLVTHEKTLEISFANDGVKFLNDVCAAAEGGLLVSATDKNRIYLVNPKEKTAKPIKFDHDPKGPNGLVFAAVEEEAYVGVAEWGADNKPNGVIRVYLIDCDRLEAEEVPRPEDSPIKAGYMDGLSLMLKNGKIRALMFSDWVAFKPGGKLFYSDSTLEDRSKSLTELAIPDGPVAGPADFFHDDATDAVVLPSMIDGRVLIMKLENGH